MSEPTIADRPEWEWEVTGTEDSYSVPRRLFNDHGTIECEGAGDALDWLVQRGPFWDGLDADQEFTITIRPKTVSA